MGGRPSDDEAQRGARPAEAPADADQTLVDRAREGDEGAYVALLGRHHRAVVRVARAYVKTDASAEEIAQETWLAVLSGIEAFEGRSAFRTWLLRIVANLGRRRGTREGRSVPMSALARDDEDAGPIVEPSRFLEGDPRWSGHWLTPPAPLDAEAALLHEETRALVATAIEALPEQQRLVITLRDVQELSAEEACVILGISEGNQRVLLHRARGKVRAALEAHLELQR